jgi:hypothetical protein
MRALWQALSQRLREEPAMVFSLISAGLAVGAAFGLDITEEQRNAILGLAAVIVGGGVATRRVVVPEAKRLREQREADRRSR